jgi:hypothetical protein
MTAPFWISVSRLPYFLILVVALVFAISRWNRHPVASALLAAGSAMDLVLSVVSTLVVPFVSTGEPDKMMMMYAGIGVLNSVALGLILLAAFSDRKNGAGESDAFH